MDPLTHALASCALKRSAFSRTPRSTTIAMLVAGTIADLDYLSRFVGPSAFLAFHRTYFHSVLAAILLSVLVILPFYRHNPATPNKLNSLFTIFVPALAASVLHVLLDLSQSGGIELLWPFSARRFSLDWLPPLDLWIFGILLAGILLPSLSRLVTEEIGAKSKGPHGKLAASLALAAAILYLGARCILHNDALATLESRTYRGESPRKAAAFSESNSPFLWHGIVETERALHDVDIEVGPAASFDPDSAITSYKPEPSPALDAARDTLAARRFLHSARFPKATIEKTPDSFRILLRDFPYSLDPGSGPRVHALIVTDLSGKVLSEELVWDSPRPTSR